MQARLDPIAFYRHVLRCGDLRLARRLTPVLRADPQYRACVDHVLRALPAPGPEPAGPGARMLGELLARIDPPGDNRRS